SQLGIPLLVRGELVGVLCVESDVPYRFHEEDKTSIELLGSYLAIAIQNMQLHESGPEPVKTQAKAQNPQPKAQSSDPKAQSPGPKFCREVVYYQRDECILVDGEYLIRSLPANILWKLLRRRHTEGRI